MSQINTVNWRMLIHSPQLVQPHYPENHLTQKRHLSPSPSPWPPPSLLHPHISKASVTLMPKGFPAKLIQDVL